MKKVLTTILVIIVIIALAIVMFGVYEYLTTNVENEKTSDSNDVENEIDNEEDEILEIGITKKEKTELEEKAKSLLMEYEPLSGYQASNVGAMYFILAELELMDENELEEMVRQSEYTLLHVKTTVKYDDFKNAILKYVTEEYFNKYFFQYKNMEGYVGVQKTAAGIGTFEVEEVELVSIENGEYKFNIKLKDVELYDHFVDGDPYVKENEWIISQDATFIYENDRFVISEYSDYTLDFLEGVYAIDASDVGLEFFKDGTVISSSNWVESKGTYGFIEENRIEVIFEEDKIWSEENPGEFTIEKRYDESEFIVIDENTLKTEFEADGEKYEYEYVKVR